MADDPLRGAAVSGKRRDAGPKNLGAGFSLSILKDEGRTFAGFTLLELMVVISILGALSAISVPMYVGYVGKARATKCVSDIYHLERLIKVYEADLGQLPNSLVDIGMQNFADPWGNPYQYLNIQTFTNPGGGGGGQNQGGGGGGQNQGGGGGGQNQGGGGGGQNQGGGGGGNARPRMDRFLVPINSDFDLYSMGPDGRSVAPMTARMSRDDIVRASNGRFVGPATEY
jgi:general secretion pathway protein G